MPVDAYGLDSDRWRDIDSGGDAEFFVGYLDRAAAGLRAARVEAIEALAVPKGAAVLDVGCGVGQFIVEIAQQFPGVHVIGIDASAKVVEVARARAERAGASVQFHVGLADQLEFVDQAFDRVNCSRVLVHLDDPAAAIAEMHRVLKRGGRVSIWEPDFDALLIDSDDLATSDAVRGTLTRTLSNPDIGRRLRRLACDAGLKVTDVTATARPVSSLEYANQQFHLFAYLDAAVDAGVVSEDAGRRWRTHLERADVDGTLWISPVGFRLVAERPD
jgi:SAM-dependent methyltransferase